MKLPDPLSRRHLLEGTLEASKALALAKAYLEEGREVEAVDFLAAADAVADGGAEAKEEARSALLGLQEVALERGDVFLMRVASGALGEETSQKNWQALAEAAKNLGRERDAETALRLATVQG
ncbi:MAG: hypothetical protein H8E78_09945 [Proteobacteria bacterium]|nr:hypothetical protein [Pseudomonadota bacterium]